MIVLKSSRELAIMRQAGRIVAQVHQLFREVVRPGITTADRLHLDRRYLCP